MNLLDYKNSLREMGTHANNVNVVVYLSCEDDFKDNLSIGLL